MSSKMVSATEKQARYLEALCHQHRISIAGLCKLLGVEELIDLDRGRASHLIENLLEPQARARLKDELLEQHMERLF